MFIIHLHFIFGFYCTFLSLSLSVLRSFQFDSYMNSHMCSTITAQSIHLALFTILQLFLFVSIFFHNFVSQSRVQVDRNDIANKINSNEKKVRSTTSTTSMFISSSSWIEVCSVICSLFLCLLLHTISSALPPLSFLFFISSKVTTCLSIFISLSLSFTVECFKQKNYHMQHKRNIFSASFQFEFIQTPVRLPFVRLLIF